LRNIFVPDATDRLGTFWRIGGGEDQKNDFMRAENLNVSGCEVGLLVEGRNSLNHELFGCVFKGRGAGQTGIRTWNGGSVRLFGGAVNQFVVVRDCWFGTGTPEKTVYKFRYDTTQPIGDFVFEDCTVRASNASGHWPGRPPRSLAGSLLYLGTSIKPQPMPGPSPLP
jgi:hypothetical protein